MRIEAVVPLKRLARAKSRLAGALAEPERLLLVRAMLARVIEALSTVAGLARVSVLTVDSQLVPAPACHLQDTGEELNSALEHAALTRRAAGADVLLIVAADLPFISREDVDALLAASRGGGVVAAPDWQDSGTNALMFPLVPGLALRFGPGSFAAHEAEARGAGLAWRVVRQPGLAFDLDEPSQLELLGRDARYAFLPRSALR